MVNETYIQNFFKFADDENYFLKDTVLWEQVQEIKHFCYRHKNEIRVMYHSIMSNMEISSINRHYINILCDKYQLFFELTPTGVSSKVKIKMYKNAHTDSITTKDFVLHSYYTMLPSKYNDVLIHLKLHIDIIEDSLKKREELCYILNQ